jgi:P pilus assembly chaperone PapD
MMNSSHLKTKSAISINPINWLVVLTITLSVLLSLRTSAQGNLLVTPKRLIFDGSKRAEELNLANTGKDSATYVISFIQLRMKEDGSVENITQPDSAQLFADKNLRFFPRMVTLGPGEAQTVKVQLTKTNELKPGEYRSHLYFRAIPNEKPLGEPSVVKDSTISVRLVPIFGISIPAIIRVGEADTKVSFAQVGFQMENETPTVEMTFNRAGNMSVYGDVSVEYVSTQGKVTRVGGVKGLALYTPNSTRHFRLSLNPTPSIDFHTGKLRIVYADQSPKATKFAEREIVLQ